MNALEVKSLIDSNDKAALGGLDLTRMPDAFWEELISFSEKVREWVSRRKYLSPGVFEKLAAFPEEDVLIALAANPKFPPEYHGKILEYGGEPLRILLELRKEKVPNPVLAAAIRDTDPYIQALAMTILKIPISKEIAEKAVAIYGLDFLHKFLTEPGHIHGFMEDALEWMWGVSEKQIHEYIQKYHSFTFRP
jgi:hypothetical protein